ncbi:MAG: PEGA domain-containing protein [Myxococcaceae bacterium]|nr:PEGA domain-containing protein [Myxococcaceae bacterium]
MVRSALIGVLLSGLAQAKAPRLVVEAVGLDQAATAAAPSLAHLAEAAARDSGRFEVLRTSDVLDPAGADARSAKAAEAAGLVAQGKKDLDDLDTQKALQHFAGALAAYRAADLSREDTFQAFVEAWVLKAGAHVAQGEAQAAKQEIERIIGVAPRAEFPDALFPPDFLKVVEQQRRMVAKASGTLELTSTPAGARVWIDGTFRGVTPLSGKGLAGAKHLVVVSLPGYAQVQDELLPGAEAFTLSPLKSAEAVRVLERSVQASPATLARDEAARTFARLARAEQALLVVAKKSVTGERLELTALRLDVKDGHNLAYRVTTLPAADEGAVSAFLSGLFAADEPRQNGAPVTHGESSGGGSGRVVAGISLLAASGALAAVGIACGVSAGAKAVEYQQNPQVRTQVSQNLATQGRTFSVLADVSFLTALASAGVGTYLLASAPKGPSTEPEEAPRPRKDGAAKRAPPPPPPDRGEAQAQKKKDDEAAAKKREEDAAAQRRRDDEAQALKKKDEEAAAKKREDDAAAAQKRKGDDGQAKAKDDQRRRDEEQARQADEERKKKEAEEKKKAEEERRRQEEEAARKKKEADDKKKHEEDDLRNY